MTTSDYLSALQAQLDLIDQDIERVDDQGDAAAVVRVRGRLAPQQARLWSEIAKTSRVTRRSHR